jgi:hypothetical protein
MPNKNRTASLPPLALPPVGGRASGGKEATFKHIYEPVALSYASTGIKPVVGSPNKMNSEPPTIISEAPNFLLDS